MWLGGARIKSLSSRSIFDTRLPRPRHCVITTSKRFTTEVWRRGRSPPASRRRCRRVQTASPRRRPRGRVERVRSGNNFLTYLRLHLLVLTNCETPRNPLLSDDRIVTWRKTSLSPAGCAFVLRSTDRDLRKVSTVKTCPKFRWSSRDSEATFSVEVRFSRKRSLSWLAFDRNEHLSAIVNANVGNIINAGRGNNLSDKAATATALCFN